MTASRAMPLYATPAEFLDIDVAGRTVSIELQWVGRSAAASAGPTVVFLHEGLGSVAAWKDFPATFCERHSYRGLVFSRPGYGRSTPRRSDETWGPDFMHRQAHEVLPALFAALDIDRPWLFGHSDGASIALLHAARFEVAGVVALAPHVFVEDVALTSIAAARAAYRDGDLRARLGRYHADVDSAFHGWNDVWLSPAFRSWNIERELDGIACPVLAVQGEDDEYGTLEQIHAIARRLPQTRELVLVGCAHSPQRDQPEQLMAAAAAFIDAQNAGAAPRRPEPIHHPQEPRCIR